MRQACRRGRICRRTKHLESHLEVIQSHTFLDHWKADEGLRNNDVGFRVGNFEGNVWPSPFSRTPLSFGATCLSAEWQWRHHFFQKKKLQEKTDPNIYSHRSYILQTTFIRPFFVADCVRVSSVVVLVLVLVLKESLRTKFKSWSWSLSLRL